MKIDVTVKVKNDNSTFTKCFDKCELLLSDESDELLEMITVTQNEFNQEIDEVSVTCKMRDI